MLQPEQEIHHLKQRIASVYARREQLKQALELGGLAPRVGFAQLEATDQALRVAITVFVAGLRIDPMASRSNMCQILA